MSAEKIAIVGTGTDVGKTVLSLLIMQYLFSQGQNPLYIKPFQTGCKHPGAPGTDAAFIYEHIVQLKDSDPSYSIINCHSNPKAPYFAARDMNQQIDVQKTLFKIKEKEDAGMNGKNISHLVIEAAGGLLVPVSKDTTVADFIVQTGARPIIAAHAGLGTINHTLLTLQCFEHLGVKPAGVVLMDSGNKKTDPDMVNENIEAIESFSGITVAGVIEPVKNFMSPCPKAQKVIEQMLKLI